MGDITPEQHRKMVGIRTIETRSLTLLEEETYLIPALEEVLIADMFVALGAAGGELGHRVIFEGEGVQQAVGLDEQALDGFCGEGIGDDEEAVVVEGLHLFGGEAVHVCWVGVEVVGWWWESDNGDGATMAGLIRERAEDGRMR